MATYSGILSWEILRTEKPTVHVVAKELDTTKQQQQQQYINNFLSIILYVSFVHSRLRGDTRF